MITGKKRRRSTIDSDTAALHKQWEESLCPICMDHPHNAVQLHCTSDGCRPYICDTSYRHSNCLDRYRKLTTDRSSDPNMKCPLCRAEVQSWEVVKDARKYLNMKSRVCTRESCSFTGNYKELRRHARSIHPSLRPAAETNLKRQRAWRELEQRVVYDDIVSSIRSAIPDFVIVITLTTRSS